MDVGHPRSNCAYRKVESTAHTDWPGMFGPHLHDASAEEIVVVSTELL